MAFLLLHGAERSMGNIFRVSHILQHISNKQVEVKLLVLTLPGFISICIFQFFNLCSNMFSVHLSYTRWSFAIDLFSNVLFQIFHYF